MQQRKLGEFSVSALGLGCMNLSHAYGTPPAAEEAEALLDEGIPVLPLFLPESLKGPLQ